MAIQFLNTVAVDTNVLYVDTSSDRVGIGTTLPDGLLHVSSGTSGDAVVIIESDTDNSDENDNPHVELRQDGGGVKAKLGIEGNAGNTYSNSLSNATYLGTVFEQSLQFITGNTGGVQTAKMTIQPNTGNVGIGTNNPDDGNLQIGDSNSPFNISFAGPRSKIGYKSDNTIVQGGTSKGISFCVNNSTFGLGEAMRIDSSGNVGIGTTSPGEKLTLQTQANGLGSEGVFIKNTFAGSAPVVNSKSPFLSLATSTGFGYTSTIYMGRNGTATDQESKIEWSSSTDALSIYVKGQGSYQEHVRFGNISSGTARTYFNGNVGIGTSSPGQKLDVIGVVKSQFNSGDYAQLESNSSGGVIKAVSSTSTTVLFRSYGDSYILNDLGIGTSSPNAKLDVNGGVRIANDTSAASASNVGTLKYYTSGNNSYVDMCMQTGATTYAWVNIVENNW